MRAEVTFAVCLFLAFSPPSAHAQGVRTPAESVRLTPEQWACLQNRMTNLLRSQTHVVRVPLSPCDQVRGPGAGNTTAGTNTARRTRPPERTDPTLTRAPLYLTRDQLTCIQRRLPELTNARGATEIDFSDC